MGSGARYGGRRRATTRCGRPVSSSSRTANQPHVDPGGMGEVYKARDTRLDRTVALKIRPSQFSADPERLARFEREAKMIAP